jgi:serpin B
MHSFMNSQARRDKPIKRTRPSKQLTMDISANPDKFEDEDEALHSAAVSNEKLSCLIYNVMKKEHENLIMSPFSISCVIAMVSTGARGNTLQQIQSAFFFPSDHSLQLGYQQIIPAIRSTDNFIMETANTIFAMEDFSLLPEYEEILTRNFHSSIQRVDFGDTVVAAARINNWVEEVTREKIKNLITEKMLSSETMMVLISALYFKADWKTKFDRQRTTEEPFFVSPTLTVESQMMKKKGDFLWANLETLACTMVELPYTGGRCSLQVLLPNEKHKIGEVEEKLMNHRIQELFELASNYETVDIQLPKFKLEQTINLKNHLVTLGVEDMFMPGLADFSGIDGTSQLCVSRVLQKVSVEITEDGTEAAAATAVILTKAACPKPSPSKQFVANHPFIFFMRDRTTGMLLFMGKMANPQAGAA